ncbi:DNA mismatch repair endonuclease MutL [Avibacterium paragallinarum]|uniref:DNA mismatch repair protein MutL n=1 Tax=Avibacterium paragallinarum TaxID=728 RepID=A0A2V4F794_AVIPA|nr:DNA mismatch repair endonuclease MutL [Avibacterium paragallinarum]MEE3608674.1 DNA mismatch repair endonuclease MutL [Avibacterium paragallinarum]MEE3621890.1 DNA mismatch repair endonuclease MutL [Avibacterium paragallinarum]MEE3668892.1 DNA mismatch repair endonuclease MutL [Avibacterium paragallinarum]MEE3680462.1 DNA mismatch repair endonuclease MutL [Avibacterium paragallinarum]MEE4385707.1 DNA mismatch repair endonuclease MutL [Avibacterium paragallinarum]
MPIQILPPQLANQIAAGEVVERPASVVKELVENSLDAGATRIQIEVENGGASLIRIRDNGIGIPKEELALALARHATSKIASIEDLEAILSLGFRGEALASISSVSRLTLTSRTENQKEAWQVYAQGREMETTITPASHPVGTTVEVANLFFNTPARRKFLRTDKTEFAHIDEVIRRIALAKPHIAFTLTHNGKTVRQYKSAVDFSQKLKRIATICGEEFIQHALHIDWKHDDLHLSGWVAAPNFKRSQNDLNYSYVNGRMVRDKVITHAIRQAYADYLGRDEHPAYILFIDLNPNDVDVNVHPTKHEVRFQQSRLVHDFIYQGVQNALLSSQEQGFVEQVGNGDHLTQLEGTTEQSHNQPSHKPQSSSVQEPAGIWQPFARTPRGTTNRAAAGRNIFQPTNEASYNITAPNEGEEESLFPAEQKNNAEIAPHCEQRQKHYTPSISKTVRQAYVELMGGASATSQTTPRMEIQGPEDLSAIPHNNAILRTLALVENKALLLQQAQQFYLLPIKALQTQQIRLSLQQDHIEQQPLLIPILFRLDETQQKAWQQQKAFFEQAGFAFNENFAQHRISLTLVPSCLRQQNLQQCVGNLLNQHSENFAQFLTALCEQLDYTEINVLGDAVNLLTEIESLLHQQNQIRLSQLLIPIDWQHYLN